VYIIYNYYVNTESIHNSSKLADLYIVHRNTIIFHVLNLGLKLIIMIIIIIIVVCRKLYCI